jgi:hypothetical protein
MVRKTLPHKIVLAVLPAVEVVEETPVAEARAEGDASDRFSNLRSYSE